MTSPTTLAARVRDRRKALGMTQEALAFAAGCCVTTVQNTESGKYRPRLATLERIAAELGVGVQDLIENPRASAPTSSSESENNRT